MRLNGACEARALGQLTPVIAVNISSCKDHVVDRSFGEYFGGEVGQDWMRCFVTGFEVGGFAVSVMVSGDRSRKCEGEA